jgi:hypothetical protein
MHTAQGKTVCVYAQRARVTDGVAGLEGAGGYTALGARQAFGLVGTSDRRRRRLRRCTAAFNRPFCDAHGCRESSPHASSPATPRSAVGPDPPAGRHCYAARALAARRLLPLRGVRLVGDVQGIVDCQHLWSRYPECQSGAAIACSNGLAASSGVAALAPATVWGQLCHLPRVE